MAAGSPPHGRITAGEPFDAEEQAMAAELYRQAVLAGDSVEREAGVVYP
jgi:hypothetical protein